MASSLVVESQTIQTIYSFPYIAIPNELALGSDGNFYGTTQVGGITNSTFPYGMGTVFQVTPNGTLSTLALFTGINGESPQAALTLGSNGNLYGTTEQGGTIYYLYNDGTVFQVTTNGTISTLDSFYGQNGDLPIAGLTVGNDGNFYGTTGYGGSNNDGTVFQLATNGTLTTLVSFAGNNGAHPLAALTLGNNGSFYGTTLAGGTSSDGTVFQVTTNGTLTSLYSFTNLEKPSGLTLGTDGKFYGTTQQGGIPNYTYGLTEGMGTIFQVTTNGTFATLVLFNFTNGTTPHATLTLGNDGNFYGTTEGGGTANEGTVFRVTTNGALTTLASFDITNGAGPVTPLTLGNDGNFYGTTEAGGSGPGGTVFRLLLPPVIRPTLTLQFSAGCPQLALTGTLSNNFVVQCSTNLANPNWLNLVSLTNLLTSPYVFLDSAGVGQPERFYRAVMQ